MHELDPTLNQKTFNIVHNNSYTARTQYKTRNRQQQQQQSQILIPIGGASKLKRNRQQGKTGKSKISKLFNGLLLQAKVLIYECQGNWYYYANS